jgi:hypothetical protein
MPRFHSFAHAGAYPDLPSLEFSHRNGNTSLRPAKSCWNSAILSTDESGCVRSVAVFALADNAAFVVDSSNPESSCSSADRSVASSLSRVRI